jgi:hypothetical protein
MTAVPSLDALISQLSQGAKGKTGRSGPERRLIAAKSHSSPRLLRIGASANARAQKRFGRSSKDVYGVIRLVLQYSLLPIYLVPKCLTVMTVKLGRVDGQQHDRQHTQEK